METKKYYRLNDASNGSLITLIKKGQFELGSSNQIETYKPNLISYQKAEVIGKTLLVLALFSGLFFFGLSA